jgi:hypothetical protein
MARLALSGVIAMLVAVGASGAATMPAFLLKDGQTRYLLPSQVHVGEVIRCTVNGKRADMKMPASTGAADWAWSNGGPTMSIDRRPNGATELRCGSAVSGTGTFQRLVDPYVIGQNGLALIRGRNTFAALKRTFGAPSTVSQCRAAWRSIGLVATFAGASCKDASVLTGATVEGARWGSLRGVRVGDSVGKLVWQAQDAKRVAPGQWLLASGGTSHRAKLVAVTRSGKVTSFVLSGV